MYACAVVLDKKLDKYKKEIEQISAIIPNNIEHF